MREWIWEGTGCRSSFDGHYVARLERGVVRWPKLEYREALRGILQVATDLELGFYPPVRGFSTQNQNSLLEAVRAAWAKTRKIDIHGQNVVLDADHPLAEPPTTRVGRARAKQTLPNGYCGLPIESDCEHANPCLTCALFVTTPAFLSQHQARLRSSLKLIDQAEEAGHLRLAEKNRSIADNLTQIINACQPECAGDHEPATEDPSSAGPPETRHEGA
ncbi:hypothetical protein ACFV9C_41635 [Kribbella sp. NPDC059898]|uniref:hypothetical protein n=1 Tax=Kribbella sp. NPDC059898 TaxID=3346995 RepID=UPI00365A8360